MRTTPRTASASAYRALLAFLLAGAFGFRVAASPAAWGCLTGDPPAHSSHQSQDHDHDPQHHGPGGPSCECIAHAGGTGLTVKPAELARTALLPAPSGAALFGDNAPLVTSPSHLLPFSVGPPSLPPL